MCRNFTYVVVPLLIFSLFYNKIFNFKNKFTLLFVDSKHIVSSAFMENSFLTVTKRKHFLFNCTQSLTEASDSVVWRRLTFIIRFKITNNITLIILLFNKHSVYIEIQRDITIRLVIINLYSAKQMLHS